jgi:hypothetical protein
MNNALAVGFIQRVGELDGIFQDVFERQRSLFETLGEGMPLLHDEVIHSVMLPDVMQRADVRMIERRDCLRFALESFAKLGLRGRPRQNLDRDRTIQPRVSRLVYLSHATGADS